MTVSECLISPLETADLATFTEEILNGKLHFLRFVSCYNFSANFSTYLLLSHRIYSCIKY